jgi:hypothetical protein
VKILEKTPTKIRCQFVGSMYFHPSGGLNGGQDMEVTTANTEGTEDIEVQAEIKVQKGTDKHKPNHPEAKEGVRQMVQHRTNSQPYDLNRRIETQALVDKAKTEAACASEDKGDPNSQNIRLLSEAKNGNKVEVGQLIGRGANVGF